MWDKSSAGPRLLLVSWPALPKKDEEESMRQLRHWPSPAVPLHNMHCLCSSTVPHRRGWAKSHCGTRSSFSFPLPSHSAQHAPVRCWCPPQTQARLGSHHLQTQFQGCLLPWLQRPAEAHASFPVLLTDWIPIRVPMIPAWCLIHLLERLTEVRETCSLVHWQVHPKWYRGRWEKTRCGAVVPTSTPSLVHPTPAFPVLSHPAEAPWPCSCWVLWKLLHRQGWLNRWSLVMSSSFHPSPLPRDRGGHWKSQLSNATLIFSVTIPSWSCLRAASHWSACLQDTYKTLTPLKMSRILRGVCQM